jgi:hypothetical protein
MDLDGGRLDPDSACNPGSDEWLWQQQPVDGLGGPVHVFFFFLFFLFDLRRQTKQPLSLIDD